MSPAHQLNQQAIEEFKAIYEAEFGQTISNDEVQEIALRLLRFFDTIRQPVSKEIT
jgi:hypothetical protein